ECKHLKALGDQHVICWTCDLESTPEPHALHPVQPTFNHELISKFGRSAIINLCSHDYRIPMVLGHLSKRKTEFFGEKRARDLDETQIGDIRNDTSAIGIEKHHLHLCANARSNGHGRISNFRL